MIAITEELMNKFDGLACRLSPENLCCDCEISRAEVNQRHTQIKREWKVLEKKAGRKVSENEVLNWQIKKYR